MHGDIDYKFCWLHPQSKNTSWTWISWDTNWEPRINKEENQRRNLTSSNFAWLCEIFAKHVKCPKGDKLQDREQGCEEFRTLCEISQALRISFCVIFKYFCTDSVRFLSQDILCNYLFSHCNQLKIFLDI